MNTYASVADMKARYPDKDLRELTDENGVTVQDAVIASALADASAVIDGYLNGRYALPLTSVPRNLIVHCCAMAMYALQSLRTGNAIEDVRTRYEDAIAYFVQVSKGTAQLAVDATTEAPAVQTEGPTVVTATRRFDHESMKGF